VDGDDGSKSGRWVVKENDFLEPAAELGEDGH
jgi:hypothetical protein